MAGSTNARRRAAALFLATTLLLAGASRVALAQTPPATPPPTLPPSPRCPDNLVLLSGGIISVPDALAIIGGLLSLGAVGAVDCLCITFGQITAQIRDLLIQGRIVVLPIGFRCGTPIPPNPIPGNPPPDTPIPGNATPGIPTPILPGRN